MDGRSAFSVQRFSTPFGLHATRTYHTLPRPSSHHLRQPQVTSQHHVKASGLVLVPWHDTPPLRSSVPRVNDKHAHLTQAQCRPRLEEISGNQSISRQVCNVTPGAKCKELELARNRNWQELCTRR